MHRDVAVSIVVPVFGDGRALPELVERTAATLDRSLDAWEIILVNDGSPAPTWERIREIARDDARVIGVRLSRNFGQHNALLAGIRLARGAAIVTLDDDLQQPPEAIPGLVAALDAHDVVYGRPREATHGIWRNAATVLVKLALRTALGPKLSRDVSAFRAFRRRLADTCADVRGPYVNLDVWLNRATDNVAARDVVFEQRKYGSSQYSIVGLARHALKLFALGVMGEYLARMYVRILERPAYVIDTVIDERRGAGRPASSLFLNGP